MLMLLTGVTAIALGFTLTFGILIWQSGQQQAIAEQYLKQTAYTNIAIPFDRPRRLTDPEAAKPKAQIEDLLEV
ncbi:hypothetical protein [Brenneria corticis]|uniref:Uncharacterized protein n=1 Tax=Brenneria corticis TaxID=2173106 RepID=A0A2U1UCZ6_9GAMM|nr:hypothetical protein [Brenneria sp. CFCC 11842]PWC19541.1 hypothetical protein DDT56_00780 [Brenneria sp. CFCC 11842]